MKAVALLLLVACAPAPASLPFVRVDRSLKGAVVSREAAEAIAARLKRRDYEWEQKLIKAEAQRDKSDERARVGQWWKDNGPWLVGVAGAVGAAVGAAVGVAVEDNDGR